MSVPHQLRELAMANQVHLTVDIDTPRSPSCSGPGARSIRDAKGTCAPARCLLRLRRSRHLLVVHPTETR